MECIPKVPIDLSEPVMQAMVAASIDHHAVYKSFSLEYTERGINTSTKVAKCTVKYLLGGCEKSLQVYVKFWPGIKKTFFINEMTKLKMEKEAYFYQFVLRPLNNELSRIGADKVNCVKYLYYHNFDSSQALFLDQAKGFKALDRTATFSLDYALVAIAELAKLHAASVLMMRKDGQFIECTAMTEILIGFLNNKRSVEFFEKLYVFYAEITKQRKLQKISEFFEKFKHYGKTLFENLFRCKHQFLVLCHGGPWIKDILFSHDENGAPNGCLLIDYQSTRFGSFGLDLSYFLYVNMDQDVRVPNLKTILHAYYDTFTSFLAKDNVNMPFTWNEMVNECIGKLFFGFYMMTDVIRNLMCEANDCPTVDDYMLKDFTELTEEKFQYFKTNEKICDRLETVLLELEKAGVFDLPDDGSLEKDLNPNSAYFSHQFRNIRINNI